MLIAGAEWTNSYYEPKPYELVKYSPAVRAE